jgi:aryl-alcohol dehydrogenase-like predicted oxidoreductase
MEHRHLGRSGLAVSHLGLGTMTWGSDTDETDAAELLTTFVEAGGSLVDTADVYCGGDSERVLGSLIGAAVARDDLVIGTKAVLTAGGARDASRRHLLAALDASLDRLGVDHVDLWQLHAYDTGTPLEETLSALDAAVSSGRVRYAGVSNYAAWQLARAATWQCAWPGRTPIVSVQVEYSLLRRDAEDDVVPAAEDLGVGVLAWSPLGRGVLTGKYRTGIPADSRAATPHYADFVQPYLGERGAQIVESVSTAAEGLGVAPLTVALSWVRDRPGVTSAIVGARTAPQLAAILESESIRLPTEIRDALDDVSSE